MNLLNAVRTAAAAEARGQGVLVVLNDEINGARDVTKTNTYRVETFRSPELEVQAAECMSARVPTRQTKHESIKHQAPKHQAPQALKAP